MWALKSDFTEFSLLMNIGEQDIDCMPVHPLENMPEVMRRRRVIVDGIDRNLEDTRVDLKSKVYVTAGGAARAALNERLERPISLPSFAPPAHMSFHTLSKRAQVSKNRHLSRISVGGKLFGRK